MSALHGADELRKRIRAMGEIGRPIGRDWGRHAQSRYRASIPVRTGATRQSLRVEADTHGGRVIASAVAVVLDTGAKPHDIVAVRHQAVRFKVGGTVKFARRVHHRGMRGRPYLARGARAALRDTDITGRMVDAWNRAA